LCDKDIKELLLRWVWNTWYHKNDKYICKSVWNIPPYKYYCRHTQ